MNSGQTTGPRWFSENESKAWGEKFFLIYSPVWMLIMGLAIAFGILGKLNDWGYMAFSLLIALPLVVIPAVIRDESHLNRRWHETFWFKANLYIFVFAFPASYFGTEYFFDILGMIYNCPAIKLNFDSALVGTGEQQVPVIMYILAQAYLITYHTSAVVVLRRIRTSGLPIGKAGWCLAVLIVSLFWAWAETKGMANPWIKDQFTYKDVNRMLSLGSFFYACYFITSFPVFFYIDEKKDEDWSLVKICVYALAAWCLSMMLVDFLAKIFGPI